MSEDVFLRIVEGEILRDTVFAVRHSAQLRRTDMDKHRIEGAVRQVKGAVKETVGKVTGDAKTQAEGAAEKAAGKVQNAVGGVKDAVRDSLKQ